MQGKSDLSVNVSESEIMELYGRKKALSRAIKIWSATAYHATIHGPELKEARAQLRQVERDIKKAKQAIQGRLL